MHWLPQITMFSVNITTLCFPPLCIYWPCRSVLFREILVVQIKNSDLTTPSSITTPEEVTETMNIADKQKPNSSNTRHSGPCHAVTETSNLGQEGTPCFCTQCFYCTIIMSRNTGYKVHIWPQVNELQENICAEMICTYTCCRPTSTLQRGWDTQPAKLTGAGIKCESGRWSRWTDFLRREGGNLQHQLCWSIWTHEEMKSCETLYSAQSRKTAQPQSVFYAVSRSLLSWLINWLFRL